MNAIALLGIVLLLVVVAAAWALNDPRTEHPTA
jgi:hypothetical protein